MQITLEVEPALASALGSTVDARSQLLRKVLADFNATLRHVPDDPQDAVLSNYFSIDVSDARAAQLQDVLLGTDGVKAAYMAPQPAAP